MLPIPVMPAGEKALGLLQGDFLSLLKLCWRITCFANPFPKVACSLSLVSPRWRPWAAAGTDGGATVRGGPLISALGCAEHSPLLRNTTRRSSAEIRERQREL